MPYARTIAIDGPAACGKSTLGKHLAEKLGYFFLDTGILYRAIARHTLNEQINVSDAAAVEAYAKRLTIDILQLHPHFDFRLNGSQVSDLYSTVVDEIVPMIAGYRSIREKVRVIQRQIAANGRVILAGRDIGSVVLPDADLKIYLNPSLEERVARRFANQNRNHNSLEAIRQALLTRDLADTARGESPLYAAENAVIIVTDGMAVEDVAALVLAYAQRAPQP